jgi:hypothetical protein
VHRVHREFDIHGQYLAMWAFEFSHSEIFPNPGTCMVHTECQLQSL